MISAVVIGIDELDAKLKYLHTQAANKIARAVVRVGLKMAANDIRRRIKPTIAPRTADRGIGISVKRKAGSGVVGKTGVAVGDASKRAIVATNRGRRKGVGVSARNLHWFALGTQDRYTGSVRIRNKAGLGKRKSTGNARRYTGRIEKSRWGGFVKNYSLASVQHEMRVEFQRQIERAATKGVSGAAEVAVM